MTPNKLLSRLYRFLIRCFLHQITQKRQRNMPNLKDFNKKARLLQPRQRDNNKMALNKLATLGLKSNRSLQELTILIKERLPLKQLMKTLKKRILTK